jgi:hypothetical protein
MTKAQSQPSQVNPDFLVSRKDIAARLGRRVSPDAVERNERNWGLDMARVKFKTRPVLYIRSKVEAILQIEW